jgi:hypothetical protein
MADALITSARSVSNRPEWPLLGTTARRQPLALSSELLRSRVLALRFIAEPVIRHTAV